MPYSTSYPAVVPPSKPSPQLCVVQLVSESVTCTEGWGLLFYWCYVIAGNTPISCPHAAFWEGWEEGQWRKEWKGELIGYLHATVAAYLLLEYLDAAVLKQANVRCS